MSIIDNIRAAQSLLGVQLKITLSSYRKPDMLLIGCVDARLNPRDDIGIPDGAAMIRRTISAVVPPYDPNDEASRKFAEVLKEVLERDIGDIAVMGHTYCGGLDGCLHNNHEGFPYVQEHLKPIKEICEKVHDSIADKNDRFVALEDRSVAQSIANIQTYPMAQEAIKAGKLRLHGWVIHTGTRRIREMDMAHPEKPFTDMPVLDEAPPKHDVIAQVRYQQGRVVKENRYKPEHKPEMIVLADMDAEINPSNDLKIEYGKALICRDAIAPGEGVTLAQKAALQFAVEAMQVKDVAVVAHYDSRKGDDDIQQAQQQVRERCKGVKQFDLMAKALKNGEARVYGWVYDNAMHPPRIYEMDEREVFKPMTMTPNCLPSLS